MTDGHEKNPDCVARGLKAAIHNPKVSTEAKDHASQQLKEINVAQKEAQKQFELSRARHQLGKKKQSIGVADLRNLTSSKQATRQLCLVGGIILSHSLFLIIADKNTSATAKKRAQIFLDEVATGKNEKRVLGGYKAALKSKSRIFTEQLCLLLFFCRPLYIG